MQPGLKLFSLSENLYFLMLLGQHKIKNSIATWQGAQVGSHRAKEKSDTNTYWHQRQLSKPGCRLQPQRRGRSPPPPSRAARSPPRTAVQCTAPSTSLSWRKPDRRVQFSPGPQCLFPSQPGQLQAPQHFPVQTSSGKWSGRMFERAVRTELKNSF